MSVHDTIGDFITVIRNAGLAGKSSCSYPYSNLRSGIAKILKDRGFVAGCKESDNSNGFKTIEIELKYVSGKHAIKGISRISKPDADHTVATEKYQVFSVASVYRLSVLPKALSMTVQLDRKSWGESCFAAFGRRS